MADCAQLAGQSLCAPSSAAVDSSLLRMMDVDGCPCRARYELLLALLRNSASLGQLH